MGPKLGADPQAPKARAPREQGKTRAPSPKPGPL